MPDIMTFGQVANAAGLQCWKLDQAFRRGILPCDVKKVGNVRCISATDLPAVRAALEKAGFAPTIGVLQPAG